MRIIKEQTACVIIDMQERLFPAMNHKEKLLGNCLKLIQGLNELSVPIIATQQYTKGLGETLPEINQLIQPFEYIEKTDFSCVEEPRFSEELKQLNKNFILLCGIESHVCVLQTAIDLKDTGYQPVAVVDCISSRFENDYLQALERYKQENILTTTCESILFELLRSASSTHFKAISKLVK